MCTEWLDVVLVGGNIDYCWLIDSVYFRSCPIIHPYPFLMTESVRFCFYFCIITARKHIYTEPQTTTDYIDVWTNTQYMTGATFSLN